MAAKICIDSDVLVNFLRNDEHAAAFILNNDENYELVTTDINAFELYYGAYLSDKSNENIKQVEQLLNRLTVLPFSTYIAKKSGELLAELKKEGKTIDFRDLFIGTAALVYGCTLKTDNVKHFKKIKGLVLQ